MKTCVRIIFMTLSVFTSNMIKEITSSKSVNPYPYQANLVIVNPINDTELHCSGSIISKRWILTAAHCLFNFDYPKYLIITVGTVMFSGIGGTNYEYEMHLLHNNWKLGIINDIALIRVKQNIIFNDNVQSINLPRTTVDDHKNFTATLSSWSPLTDLKPASYLHSAQLQVINKKECRKELLRLIDEIKDSESNRMFFTRALDSMDILVCTIPETQGISLCHGDSGAPLVVNGTQIGIVSNSYNCSGHPGIFTRVFSFIDWIQFQMSKYLD